MATENGTELVELKDWEVQELVDDAVAIGIVEDYVYSYKQGSRIVTGLTARAIEHICLESNPKISISEYNIEDTGESFFATATAKAVYMHPMVSEEKADGVTVTTAGYEEVVTAPGAADTSKIAFGKPDPHAAQKALTKACRNARRQLISQAKQLKAKEELLKLQGGEATDVTQPVNRQHKQQTQPVGDSDLDNARKAMFAKYNERKPDLEELGITDEIFRDGLYKNYGVKSRKDMTAGQYANARAALELESFAKWIRDLAPKNDDDALEGPNA